MFLLYIYMFVSFIIGMAYSVYYWRHDYKEPENVTLKKWHILIMKLLLLIIASVLAPMTAYELINKYQGKEA